MSLSPCLNFSLETRKALIIINVQNDLYIIKNHDFIPHLKKLIPYFRKDTNLFWACTDLSPGKSFYPEDTRGAQTYHELFDTVDPENDCNVITPDRSAFSQTSLLIALRKMLITEIYLCGCLTNVGVYFTAVEAVSHGLRVTVIEDCLGYRSEEKHEEAILQMEEQLGAVIVDSEGIINEYEGPPVQDLEVLPNGLCLNTDKFSPPWLSAMSGPLQEYQQGENMSIEMDEASYLALDFQVLSLRDSISNDITNGL